MKPKPVEISFSPTDNQRLANLCGALDENLKQIENALDVNIARRGEHFVLKGQSNQTEIAAQVLRDFYNQSHHQLSIEQVQLGLIEATNLSSQLSQSIDPAIDASSSPKLMTRRNNLHARSLRQGQ